MCHFRSFAEDVALHSTASGWWGAKAAPFRQSCCEKSKKRSCCTAAITKTAKKKKRAWQRCQRNCYFPNTNADSGAFFFDARFFLMRVFFFLRGVYKVVVAKPVVCVRRQGPLWGSPLAAPPPAPWLAAPLPNLYLLSYPVALSRKTSVPHQ